MGYDNLMCMGCLSCTPYSSHVIDSSHNADIKELVFFNSQTILLHIHLCQIPVYHFVVAVQK